MPRQNGKWVGFQASQEEKDILTQYCAQEEISQTTVLRQLVKELKKKINK